MAERVICNLGHAGRPDGTHISGTDALQHVPPVPVSEAEKIAELVIEKLSASVIPSALTGAWRATRYTRSSEPLDPSRPPGGRRPAHDEQVGTCQGGQG